MPVQWNGAPPMKIVIAVPSHDYAPVLFGVKLAQLTAYTTAALRTSDDLGVALNAGTYIHSARQDLALALLEQGATHVLWLDSDMTFPRDALLRLLAHNKPMVGANYCSRSVPPRFVAFKSLGLDADTHSERLYTGEAQSGLEEVAALGFGVVLTRADALWAVVEDGPPMFGNVWLDEKKQWMGEDVYFCRKLRKLGLPIYADHDLSKEVGHIGQLHYRLEHAQEFYEAPEAEGPTLRVER